jgi:uncharacterized protein (TIGR02246 family)
MKTSLNNSISSTEVWHTFRIEAERERRGSRAPSLTMRIRLLLILAYLAIAPGGPAVASPGWLSGNLAGNANALGEFVALTAKYDEACNQRDAPTLAALFTEDAVCVTPDGLLSGRQAIERWYSEHFQRWQPVNHIVETNQLNAIGQQVWSLGQWWNTLQSQNGPVFVRGYWSALFVREGDAWRIRMLTCNETPSTAARADTFDRVATHATTRSPDTLPLKNSLRNAPFAKYSYREPAHLAKAHRPVSLPAPCFVLFYCETPDSNTRQSRWHTQRPQRMPTNWISDFP